MYNQCTQSTHVHAQPSMPKAKGWASLESRWLLDKLALDRESQYTALDIVRRCSSAFLPACNKVMAMLCPVVMQLLVPYMTCLMPYFLLYRNQRKCAPLSVTGQHSHRIFKMYKAFVVYCTHVALFLRWYCMLSSLFLHVGGMHTLVLPVSSDSSSSSRLCARSRGRSHPGRL